jgi:hypothetical protein
MGAFGGGEIPSSTARVESENWVGDDGSGRVEQRVIEETGVQLLPEYTESWAVGQGPRRARIPADPVELRPLLLSLSGGIPEAAALMHGIEFFCGEALDPGVMASMLRILATEDGLHFEPRAVDLVGREGVAVTVFDVNDRDRTTYKWSLILDPTTGALLGSEQSYEANDVPGSPPHIMRSTAILESVRVDAVGERP